MLRRFRIPTSCMGSLFRRRLKSPEKMNRLFGQSLETLCQPDLPHQLAEMLTVLYKRGPIAKQIFRRSPQLGKCQEAKLKLNTGVDVSFDTLQLTVTAALLKEFLRNLPDCLLTCDNYPEWVGVIDDADGGEQVNVLIKRLVEALPGQNQLLLRHIICVLRHICDNCEVNEMTSHNMAVCVGQCLLWPPSTGQQPRDLESARKVIRLVQQMIDEADEIFGDSCVRLYSGLNVDAGLEETLATAVVDQEHFEFVSDEGLNSFINPNLKDGNASSGSWNDDFGEDDPIRRAAPMAKVKVVDGNSEPELFKVVENSPTSFSVVSVDRNVELRSPQGSFRATDSGFVDDDSAVTGTLSDTDLRCSLGDKRHAVEEVERPSLTVPVAGDLCWTRRMSEEQCSLVSEEYRTEGDCNGGIGLERGISDNGFVVRRRNFTSVDLLCRKCGLRTVRSCGPKARRRLSLPVCIRICRCRSGMTANGSDLFPTRIIDNTSLLPTVFEDDTLAKGVQVSAERTYMEDRSFWRGTSEILPPEEIIQFQRDDIGIVDDGAMPHPGTIVPSTGCDQVASRAFRSPPSYAEAILHKALRQGDVFQPERSQVFEALGQPEYRKVIESCVGLVSSKNPILAFSSGQTEAAESIVDIGRRSSQAATRDVTARMPPPAYDIATRYRCSEGCDGLASAKADGKPQQKTAQCVNSYGLPLVTLNSESSNISAVRRAGARSAEVTKCDDSATLSIPPPPLVEMTPPVCAVPFNPVTTVNCAVLAGSVVGPEKDLSCLEAPTRFFVEPDACPESLETSVPSDIISAVQSSRADLGWKQSNEAPSTEAENGCLRRRKRATKRRAGHSSSDTQIEATFGKSNKSKSIGVRRSFSDSHTTASSRTRSCVVNKENLLSLGFIRPSGGAGKRLCSGTEKKRASTELTFAREADSNNNNSSAPSCEKSQSSVFSVGQPQVISKRQVLRVKNQDWYRELVKEYSVSATICKDQIDRASTNCSHVTQNHPQSSAVAIEDHRVKANVSRLGSTDPRRSLLAKTQRPLSAMTSREVMRQLSNDGSVCKERINVTWSVSKLREKYNSSKDGNT